MPESNYDVIVIGAGIAGLVAANRAAQLGKHVAVLEKGSDEKYLCNSRLTYGTLHINYAGVEADENALVQRIEAATEGFARKDVARTLARDGRRLIQWLRDESVAMVNLGDYNSNVLAPPARTGFGLTWRGYAGDMALQRLEENFSKRQGRFLRNTRVKALQAVEGGLRLEAEGGAAFRAAAVVIADGGFTANPDMVREHIAPAADKLVMRNGGTAIGDGLRMAQALGAQIAGLSNFYGHLHAREALHSDRLWPRPYADELAAAGIVVDTTGRRVADEGHGGIYLSNAIARLPDPLATTAIFDQAIWEGTPGRGHVQPPNPLLIEAGATLHRADTIAALAAKIGVAAERLQDTVDRYNAALDTAALASLSPPRSERHKPWPIRTAPFYALPLAVGITNTMGGIVIDGAARVLGANDKPIAGLYAAGSTVGGLDGGPHAGYAGGLIKATFGLVAAETIAGKN